MKSQAKNSLECTVTSWRSGRLKEAYIAIMDTDIKMISNKMLAALLKMDPRGLRQVLEHDRHFIITLRGGNHRTEPWYSINPDHPVMTLEKEPKNKVMRTIVGGGQVKLMKGDA